MVDISRKCGPFRLGSIAVESRLGCCFANFNITKFVSAQATQLSICFIRKMSKIAPPKGI